MNEGIIEGWRRGRLFLVAGKAKIKEQRSLAK